MVHIKVPDWLLVLLVASLALLTCFAIGTEQDNHNLRHNYQDLKTSYENLLSENVRLQTSPPPDFDNGNLVGCYGALGKVQYHDIGHNLHIACFTDLYISYERP
jgi:hypothetical protein